MAKHPASVFYIVVSWLIIFGLVAVRCAIH